MLARLEQRSLRSSEFDICFGTAGPVGRTRSWPGSRDARPIVTWGGDLQQVTTRELMRHCSDLRGYVQDNRKAIVSYHRRYHSDRPVSTSRAEGCVDEIANARMSKRRRMRWSPRSAHRVAVVRATVLDGCLVASPCNQMAA